MNKRSLAFAAALLAAAAAPVAPAAPAAHAQLSNMLSGALGSGSGGGSGLGGLGGVPSVGAASPTNLAGLLQYCMQNNDLGANGTAAGSVPSTVQQSLLSKFTGSAAPPANDSSYAAGANGDLNTGNGQVALGGTGLKAQLTQRVCAEALSHAKSML